MQLKPNNSGYILHQKWRVLELVKCGRSLGSLASPVPRFASRSSLLCYSIISYAGFELLGKIDGASMYALSTHV